MTALEIIPLSAKHIPEAAALFIQNVQQQRQITPCLPDWVREQPRIEQMLKAMTERSCVLAATAHGRLVGYISWYLVDHFRGTDRKGAYVPEWGHMAAPTEKAAPGEKTPIYQALYRAAGERWAEAGCQVHAITLLAHDRAAERAWYWNGFGLTVVDAIRPMQPLEPTPRSPLVIRKATLADAAALTKMDNEHWQHYSRSPVFMPPSHGKDAAENAAFLQRPKNSAWLAEYQGELAGFMRFEGYDFDGVAILEADDGVIITGAYIRPENRGQRAAAALLDAALRDYQAQGIHSCAVTFESFNPEAATFWPRYFEPVCFSLLRVPEYVPKKAGIAGS
jgi:hypothetical protein